MSDFYVEVRKWNNEVVERMGPMSEHKAGKVDGGLTINLNHDEYYTAIVSASDDLPGSDDNQRNQHE